MAGYADFQLSRQKEAFIEFQSAGVRSFQYAEKAGQSIGRACPAGGGRIMQQLGFPQLGSRGKRESVRKIADQPERLRSLGHRIEGYKLYRSVELSKI